MCWLPAQDVSHREPKLRNVAKGRAVTMEYRAAAESNCPVRNRTTPGSPDKRDTIASGACAELIREMRGCMSVRPSKPKGFARTGQFHLDSDSMLCRCAFHV